MRHPRIEHADELITPSATAVELGYRAPAEWEPHARVWVTTPFNEETWPGCLDKALRQFDAWVGVMRRYVPVSTTAELDIATNDSWVRDFGPMFVVNAAGEAACHDFRFNNWGRKYADYQLDDLVPQHVALRLGIPIWIHDFVLEGGSIDANGAGVALTTQSCLLHPKRNPGLSREAIERKLHETLGVTRTIWLEADLQGDDTDGHIDNAARFVAEDVVVATPGPNVERLRGEGFEVIELPVPGPMFFDYPPEGYEPGGRTRLPASYANFLISNGVAFVPVFGQPSDDDALRMLGRALPGRAIEPVRAEWLIVGQGALHCLSMPQPK